MRLAIRITLPYEQVSKICERWVGHADQVIAFQHSESANRIHCHLLVIGCRVTTQRLKQLSGRKERGNGFWSFKTCNDDTDKYITYMGKGQLEKTYMSNWCADKQYEKYTHQRIIELVDQWQEPVQAVRPALSRYRKFEEFMDGLLLETRDTKEKVSGYATHYVFQQWDMFNQQVNNEIANYVKTYCFKRGIRV